MNNMNDELNYEYLAFTLTPRENYLYNALILILNQKDEHDLAISYIFIHYYLIQEAHTCQ